MDKQLQDELYKAIPNGRMFHWETIEPHIKKAWDDATLAGGVASVDLEMQGDYLTFLVIPPNTGSIEEVVALVAGTRFNENDMEVKQ